MKKTFSMLLVSIFLVVIFLVYARFTHKKFVNLIQQQKSDDKNETQQKGSTMKIQSPAFEHEQSMSSQFTCDGEDINPELRWEGVPEQAKGLVLIVDDPDAPNREKPRPEGPWVHWVVYNLPPTLKGLKQQVNITEIQGAQEGTTDFGRTGWGGACPPKGSGAHRYFFKLYALDTKLDLSGGATKKQVEDAMKGHILAQVELIGMYERK